MNHDDASTLAQRLMNMSPAEYEAERVRTAHLGPPARFAAEKPADNVLRVQLDTVNQSRRAAPAPAPALDIDAIVAEAVAEALDGGGRFRASGAAAGGGTDDLIGKRVRWWDGEGVVRSAKGEFLTIEKDSGELVRINADVVTVVASFRSASDAEVERDPPEVLAFNSHGPDAVFAARTAWREYLQLRKSRAIGLAAMPLDRFLHCHPLVLQARGDVKFRGA